MKVDHKFIPLIFAIWFITLQAEPNHLKPIELSGNEGGYANGDVWRSDFLLGTANVLIYLDPDKRSNLEKFVSYLESEKAKNDNFGITYIVNTKASKIPTFMLQKKILKKAKKSDNIAFILDKERVLVAEWKLQDDSANLLILDSTGRILYQCTGIVHSTQFEKIMKLIKC